MVELINNLRSSLYFMNSLNMYAYTVSGSWSINTKDIRWGDKKENFLVKSVLRTNFSYKYLE